MATKILLMTKLDPKLPLRFLRQPVHVLTRPVSGSGSANEAKQLCLGKASTYSTILKPFRSESSFSVAGGGGRAVFSRHIGTARSWRGSRKDADDDELYGATADDYDGLNDHDVDLFYKDDDDDDDDDNDDDEDEDEDYDDDDDCDDDLDVDDIEEEEEETPTKKKTYRKY